VGFIPSLAQVGRGPFCAARLTRLCCLVKQADGCELLFLNWVVGFARGCNRDLSADSCCTAADADSVVGLARCLAVRVLCACGKGVVKLRERKLLSSIAAGNSAVFMMRARGCRQGFARLLWNANHGTVAECCGRWRTDPVLGDASAQGVVKESGGWCSIAHGHAT
jgi:hypothetical protein